MTSALQSLLKAPGLQMQERRRRQEAAILDCLTDHWQSSVVLHADATARGFTGTRRLLNRVLRQFADDGRCDLRCLYPYKKRGGLVNEARLPSP